MVAVSHHVTWAAIALTLLLVFSVRSGGLIVITIVAIALAFILESTINVWWIILGAIVIGVFIFKKGGTGPEMYSPSMLLGG